MLDEYFTITYLLYLLRWIFSGIVMYMVYPFMNYFKIDNELIKLTIASVFGSIVFFKLDKIIFGG